MRTKIAAMLAGSSLLALASPALAQPAPTPPVASEDDGGGDIVVTARRRDELLQDVPLTVNAVTGEQIEDLNIQRFEDIETLVPGLAMSEASFATTATIRGVNFDTNVSGNNGTVEFYLNDAPVQSIYVLQSMFDVGQIEVLRGPQGTLRGRASPSGSITIAGRRPDLQEIDGYIRTGISNLENRSIEGAVSIPVIDNMLGIRLAGIIDQDVGRVESVNSNIEPGIETQGGRATIQFEPTSNLAFTLMHQRMDVLRKDFTQVESLNATDPGAPASPRFVSAESATALELFPNVTDQEFALTTFNAQYHLGGHALYYTGSHQELHLDIESNLGDTTNLFDPRIYTNASAALNDRGGQDSRQETYAHELRLQSDEPLFGFVDYVIGAFTKQDEPPTVLDRTTTIFFSNPLLSTTPGALVIHTPIVRSSESEENSYFANLNFRIGEDTEFSIGGRHIEYESTSNLVISGATAFGHPRFEEFEGDIFQASLKHNFTDNFMVYASGGESFRPGTFAVGVFSLLQSPELAAAQFTPPEESTSYELGFKSEWFDNRVRLNASIYQQEFENYPYRTRTPVYYIDYLAANQPDQNNPTVQSRGAFPMVAGVPLEVEGLEIEFGWEITDNWNLSGTLAYADAQISGGRVPCTDVQGGGPDGVPDAPSYVPTLGELQASLGTAFIAYCNVSEDATSGSPWSLSLTSEYRNTLPVYTQFEGYLRGQLSVYDEDVRTASSFDDVAAYGILNLYAGITPADGRWDLMFYARNITDEERIVRGASPITFDYRNPAATTTTTTYRSASFVTPEREFGVNLRYNFN